MKEETENNKRGSDTMTDSSETKERAKTILLIEDEEAHAELIRRIFDKDRREWDIFHVTSINGALRWLEKNNAPSLVIADYLLPDGTGLEITKRAKSAEEVGFPLIILTGLGSEQLAVRSLKSGAIDYVVKKTEELKGLPRMAERAIREWVHIIGRRRAEEELEQTNRNLDYFTSTVSHDLRAPLRSIQAFSMLLADDYADKLDETGRRYLDGVSKAAERMDALIESLLTLSRVGRKFTEVEEVDLNELLEEIKSDMRARIEEQGGVIVAGKLPTIPTQRVWMKELLTNLIDNGLKFNKADKPRIEVNCEEDGKNYIFEVIDNGIGIEAKYLSRIFNLSERLYPQEYAGTGLGLNICEKILDKFGGAIQVESKPGEGSTFCFTIPKRIDENDRLG